MAERVPSRRRRHRGAGVPRRPLASAAASQSSSPTTTPSGSAALVLINSARRLVLDQARSDRRGEVHGPAAAVGLGHPLPERHPPPTRHLTWVLPGDPRGRPAQPRPQPPGDGGKAANRPAVLDLPTEELEELRRRELPVVVLWGGQGPDHPPSLLRRTLRSDRIRGRGRRRQLTRGCSPTPTQFGEAITNDLNVARLARDLEASPPTPTGAGREAAAPVARELASLSTGG